MRVIAGEFRSRMLQAPRGMSTRPTSDRLRETLFSILGPRIPDAHFLDLYAGSGAVGIEALSRGAASCLFVENATPAIAAIRANLAALKITTRFTVDTRPMAHALEALLKRPTPFDLIFLDPPYEAANEYADTLAFFARHHAELLAPDALLIAEHHRKTPSAETIAALERTRLLEQGDAALSFYKASGSAVHG